MPYRKCWRTKASPSPIRGSIQRWTICSATDARSGCSDGKSDRSGLAAAQETAFHGDPAEDSVATCYRVASMIGARRVEDLGDGGHRFTVRISPSVTRGDGDRRVSPDALDLVGIGDGPHQELVVVRRGPERSRHRRSVLAEGRE